MHIQFYVGIIMCDMYVWQKDDERKTTEILKNDMEIKNQIEWKFIEAQCEMAVAGVWGWGRQMRWFKISFISYSSTLITPSLPLHVLVYFCF